MSWLGYCWLLTWIWIARSDGLDRWIVGDIRCRQCCRQWEIESLHYLLKTGLYEFILLIQACVEVKNSSSKVI
jgi:hypothetical protein